SLTALSSRWRSINADRVADGTGRRYRPRGEVSRAGPRRGMDEPRKSMDRNEAERRFAELLDEAGLPRFSSVTYDAEIDQLQFEWEHGLVIYLDLTGPDLEPIDEWERDAILGRPH